MKFLRWRPDRDPASCGYGQLEVPLTYDLHDVLEGELTWLRGRPPRNSTSTVSPCGCRTPTRSTFPNSVKRRPQRDLVGYYRTLALAGPMLAAVGDRPTFIERYPDGVQGDQIYQKRIARRRPEHVLSTPITFPSGRKGDALRPTVPADIVGQPTTAPSSSIPWPTRHPDNDHPDQLRIDLDPSPGTDFDDVRRVALELVHPLLDELGLFDM